MSKIKRQILIADLDKQSSRLVKNLFNAAGYETSQCYTLAECFNSAQLSPPDIIVLDPLFPSEEGLKTISRLKERGIPYVISLSSGGGERAISAILDAGADDFIKKPFLSGELLARVRVAVRKIEELEKAKGISTSESYSSKGLFVDYDRHLVSINGKTVHLTKNEFKILSLLCRYSGRVLTYDFIIKSVWGHEALGENGILRVNITNLRKKIEQDSANPQYLFTENGVGYRISESDKP